MKTVILPEGLTSTEDFAFSGCSSLTYINLPQGLSSIGCDCFEGTAITQIRVPNSVTFMDHRAFDECTQLKDVIFEDGDISLTVSRDNSGSDMFSNCPIDSIYIGRNIADSYGYFPDINIESLRTLYFGDSATRLGCWRGATNLSSVHLGKNIAHPEEYSFAECTSLKHIEFPENLGAVFYRTFYNCTALESVVLPTNAEYLGGKLFEGCTSLKSVTIPGKVIEIGYYAFSGCTSLETVVFEDGENDLAIEADYSSRDIFWACPLDSVYLGRNITRKASGTYTCQPYFPQCLKKLTIGSGVSKQWDSSWFSYCTNLKHIYPLWDKPIKTNKDMFPNNVYTSATLHVPGGTMKKYQATSAWSKFANIVPTSIGVRLTATEGGNLKIGDEVVSDGTKLLLLKPNSTLTFEVTTKDEYFLESLTMNGEDVTAQVVDGLFSTNDLSVDIEVVATFTAKPFYEVTAAAQEGGTAVVGSSSVMWGHGTTVTFTANEGYELVNVTVNGEDKINEIVNGILTLQDIKENIVVAATFEKFRYAITATDSENGSIGLSTSEAEWGDDVTVTLTPDAHYDINTVIVNGEDYTTALVGNQLTLHNVRSAMNVEATFSIQKFTVTASANAGGNIGLSAANNDDENMNMTVEWGSSVTVTIAADAEYELTNLFVDGEDVKSQVAGGQYTITSIEKDMTIEAVFKEIMEITLIDGKDYSRNNSKYYETINYVRMFDDTSWQTWYAPFDVTLTDEVMEHFDFAKFAGTYTDDKGSFYITIVRLKDGDVVKANTPYCIQAKMANSTPQVITQTDVTLEVAEENSFYVLSAEKRITFQGIYTNRAITETDQDVYAMIGGQYHKQSSDNSLVPFRCFFTMEDREDNPYAATPNPATVKLMVVGDDDIATSIGETYNSTSANGTY
ncbi:MAG: leucine-rich repeat domain-containing protein [Bacteroidaceae bacterium]|nr:leucine-rich repeat domain-containing protein [Bacteroidaceae bacterium]